MFDMTNTLISDAEGFFLKNEFERWQDPLEKKSAKAIFSSNSPGQNLSRANRIIIPYESVIEEIHSDVTNNQLPSISRHPVPSIFHMLKGEVKHNTLNNPGNVSLLRNINFLPLTTSPVAFSRATPSHLFTHSQMHSADRRNHRYHLNPASSSLQERRGHHKLSYFARPLTLKGDSSENRQPFKIEPEEGPNFEIILKPADQGQSSPTTHWSHGRINYEKPPSGPLQQPDKLNVDQSSISTNSNLSKYVYSGDSTSSYTQWLKGNKGFPGISPNPHLRGAHQLPSPNKSSPTSLTATSPLFALPSSSVGVTYQVFTKTFVSPTSNARLPGLKAPMNRYVNEIHGINYIGSLLDSAQEINQHNSSKLAFEPSRTTKLDTPKRSLHSKSLREGLASSHGYIGTLGIFDRYKTTKDPTMQLRSSSRHAVPPNRSNTLDSQISDETQVSANRLGPGIPNKQGIPATADPVVLQGPADISAADLAALLGFLPSSIHHHAAGDAAGASSGSLDFERTNMIDFGTTTTVPPHLVMEIFEHVFSEEEMRENALVRRLHDRLEHHVHRLDVSGNTNKWAALLYFLLPLVVFAAAASVLMGVTPELVGLLGLFIPGFIILTMTSVGTGGGGSERSLSPDFVRRLNSVDNIYSDMQKHILSFREKYGSKELYD
ncbi:uncharacterized protein LOC125036923 [Penaeus chinensis]|uniref:uncharacterized protein LOC125036923 n=1 Tax=Penaeus chinensis TaxID=139456 RepID=UPI001FB59698|nr:uncharacterized protein LOC125036923 [Penaeus chinensis]